MSKKFYLPVLALILTTGVACECKQSGGINEANLDRSVSPNTDFYQFACGGWVKAHPLTDEYGRFGSFDLLAENNRQQMKGLIEELAARKSEGEDVAAKIGGLYNMAMDSVKLNADGFGPVRAQLERIAGVKDKKELTKLIAEMTRQGMGAYFGVYISADDMNSSRNLLQTYQGGLGLGDRDYYLKNDAHNKEIREKYEQHVAKMFQLAGFDEAAARKAAAQVMTIETRLATASYEKVK
ncbi:MAG: M13 family metallopeptidase, partial [Odoribacter sp.]|nr:M13 family metallopeptidase [Odoribacter sp.]